MFKRKHKAVADSEVGAIYGKYLMDKKPPVVIIEARVTHTTTGPDGRVTLHTENTGVRGTRLER